MNDLNFKHLNFDRSVFSKLYGANESILEAQRARLSCRTRFEFCIASAAHGADRGTAF